MTQINYIRVEIKGGWAYFYANGTEYMFSRREVLIPSTLQTYWPNIKAEYHYK